MPAKRNMEDIYMELGQWRREVAELLGIAEEAAESWDTLRSAIGNHERRLQNRLAAQERAMRLQR